MVVVEEATSSERAVCAASLAIVPFGKGRAKQSKASVLRDKYLSDLQGKPTAELLAAMAARQKATEARLREISEAEEAREAEVEAARQELAVEREHVGEAMKEELDAALAFRAVVVRQAAVERRTEEKRYLLLEAQKKLAMIQVVQENHAAVQKLESQRVAALKAVQEAKRNIADYRLQQRKALEEATRKAPASQKGAGKKRKAAEAAADEANGGEEAPASKEAKCQSEASQSGAGAEPFTEGEAGAGDADGKIAVSTTTQQLMEGEIHADEEALCAAGA